ncbi:MAG: hypothetical protein N2049_10795 [Anaerolineales bacterium]|nr:hypothetical protein [Anaerolineales bacterium]
MYLQEILEVGIGLVFMWLVISIAAMQLQEWLANLLKWRARDLRNAIGKMLADAHLTQAFYSHQIIRGLSRDLTWNERLEQDIVNFFRRLVRKPERSSEPLPSYISSGDFAQTLADLLIRQGDQATPIKQAFEKFHLALDALPPDRLSEERRLYLRQVLPSLEEQSRSLVLGDVDPSSVDLLLSNVRSALSEDGLQPAVEALLKKLQTSFEFVFNESRLFLPNSAGTMRRLRNGLLMTGVGNPKLYESLRALWTGLEEMASEPDQMFVLAQQRVETWFNNAMARLSGWYKRKAQLASFLIGFLLAFLFNIDSIYVSTSLWREPTLRQALVQHADTFLLQNEQAPQPDGTASPVNTIEELRTQLEMLMIPFGWQTEAYTLLPGETCRLLPLEPNAVWGIRSGEICKRIANAPVDRTGWISKISGWLLTAMAAAQGAPFWFDILKKLVNVRSTGPNPSEQKSSR